MIHLTETSPCIDTGTDIGIAYVGTASDMGCYEYGSTVGINDYQIDLIIIYPNPTNNLVRFDDIINLKQIILIDVTGKRVENYTIDYLNNTIDLFSLNEGIYFLKFQIDSINRIKKIVKKQVSQQLKISFTNQNYFIAILTAASQCNFVVLKIGISQSSFLINKGISVQPKIIP